MSSAPEQRAERRERSDRKALLGKLANARKEVEPIEKTGKNTSEGFEFVEAVEVIRAANQVLEDVGVLVVPSLTASQTVFKDGGGGALTKAEFSFEVIDVDTGYSFERLWVGHGFDTQDKGIYKATTGATKYFLAGLLSIPFVGRDPEHDGEQAPAAEPEPGESAEAALVRAQQDESCDLPDPPARHERPLPESDLPAPDWNGIASREEPAGV